MRKSCAPHPSFRIGSLSADILAIWLAGEHVHGAIPISGGSKNYQAGTGGAKSDGAGVASGRPNGFASCTVCQDAVLCALLLSSYQQIAA